MKNADEKRVTLGRVPNNIKNCVMTCSGQRESPKSGMVFRNQEFHFTTVPRLLARRSETYSYRIEVPRSLRYLADTRAL